MEPRAGKSLRRSLDIDRGDQAPGRRIEDGCADGTGQLLVTMPFADERAAIELANDSSNGLVAGVRTKDLSRALRVAGLLHAGRVYVNSGGAPTEAPFGGVKNSGYGREKPGRTDTAATVRPGALRSEEHTSELQSP